MSILQRISQESRWPYLVVALTEGGAQELLTHTFCLLPEGMSPGEVTAVPDLCHVIT